jgi:Flp pilus assembly protein TadG
MTGRLKSIASFQADKAGSIVTWFVFAMVPIVLGIGLVIDYTQAASTKVKLQSAADGAALIVVRDAPNKSDAQLKDLADQFVKAAMTGYDAAVDSIAVNAARNQVTVNAHADYTTIIMGNKVVSALRPINNNPGLVATDTVRLNVSSQSTSATQTYEIALVIDNSSSMGIYQAGGGKTRLQATKDAANKLIDLMYGSSSGTATKTRMSIVPFNHAVKVLDPTNSPPSWVDANGDSSIHWENFPDPSSTLPNGKPMSPGTASGSSSTYPWPPASRFDLYKQLGVTWAGCVEHRPGALGVNDDAASANDSLFVPMFAPDETGNKDATSYSGDTYLNSYMNDNGGACTTPNPTTAAGLQSRLCKYRIAGDTSKRTVSANMGPNQKCTVQKLTRLKAQPVTNGDATSTANALKGDVNSMTTGTSSPYNMTDLVEGFMWGWRTISPKTPFADGAAYDKIDNRKIIIFMTDGKNEWGVQSVEETDNHNKSIYWPFGFYTNNRIPGYTLNTISQARTALDARTLSACGNAKAAPNNVLVYTVALESTSSPIDSTGKQVLSDCASPDPTNSSKKLAYVAQTSSELDSVFEEIAKSIGNLRLSK